MCALKKNNFICFKAIKQVPTVAPFFFFFIDFFTPLNNFTQIKGWIFVKRYIYFKYSVFFQYMYTCLCILHLLFPKSASLQFLRALQGFGPGLVCGGRRVRGRHSEARVCTAEHRSWNASCQPPVERKLQGISQSGLEKGRVRVAFN